MIVDFDETSGLLSCELNDNFLLSKGKMNEKFQHVGLWMEFHITWSKEKYKYYL